MHNVNTAKSSASAKRRRDFISPRELARALGVSESSVKRWVDDGELRAARTTGGHRRVAVAEAVRFIRATGTPVADSDLLFGDQTVRFPARASAASAEMLAIALVDALAEDDHAAASGAIVGAFVSGWSLAALADGPIRTAMRRIGELWHHSRDGIVVEHRAVDTVIQSIARIRTFIPTPPPGAPIALGGAPSGDPYLLPSLLAAAVLADQGFRDRNLGPDTPFATMLDASRRYQTRVVWVSMSVNADDERRVRNDIEHLADELSRTGTQLIVGGRALSPAPYGSPSIVRCETLGELAAYARGLIAQAG